MKAPFTALRSSTPAAARCRGRERERRGHARGGCRWAPPGCRGEDFRRTSLRPRLRFRAAGSRTPRSDTGCKVGAANAGADYLGSAAQDEVPHLVSALVVDPLEAIEVEEHERQRRAEATRASDLLLECTHESAPVREVGELVGLRLPPDEVVQARVFERNRSLSDE